MRKIELVSLGIALVILLAAVPINANTDNLQDAFKYAEKTLLPLDGICGVSYTEDPPRIIVFVEDEKYKELVPDEIKGFKTEIVISGKFGAYDAFIEDAYGYAVKNILPLEGIEAVAVNNTIPPKIVCFIADKNYKNVVPNEVKGFKTEIIVSGKFEALGVRTGKVRPLVGGISFGLPAYLGGTTGTLGVCYSYSGLPTYLLTCTHVIAMKSNGAFLPKYITPVIQPGADDGGTIFNRVGTLWNYIRLNWYSYDNCADAAVAKLAIGTTVKLNQELGPNDVSTYTVNPNGFSNPAVGDTVRKSGRTTKVTQNTVAYNPASVEVGYGGGKWAGFQNVIMVNNPFGASGDSGSFVDKNGIFVGLLFAGSGLYTIVCKAPYVWDIM